ncbi:FkbM family methyltransferase [Candidatus Uhrbacteria bacterium CG_4_10_14_0_2_um_filter_41_21]|nr:MAG: FkbM family methyltransferase [Candidatus Uhrbacteria bacterium CG_4_10_14_0_2_um_filter_41_21]
MNIISFLKKIRIRLQPRYTTFATTYPGFLCTVADKSSFLYMHEEISEKEIYRFACTTEKPFIIDCGSNIGLSVIYFKKLFPTAEIIAFEPDPNIYNILQKNIAAAKIATDVTVVQACLGDSDKKIKFYSDGADGGSITSSDVSTRTIEVPQQRLDTYVNKPVDFLKMDIEGSEYTVLQNIVPKLHLIDKIFIEYHSFVDQEQNLDNILSILKGAGFRYYIEHVGIRSNHVYIHQESYHGMDLQINIYGYRTKTAK